MRFSVLASRPCVSGQLNGAFPHDDVLATFPLQREIGLTGVRLDSNACFHIRALGGPRIQRNPAHAENVAASFARPLF